MNRFTSFLSNTKRKLDNKARQIAGVATAVGGMVVASTASATSGGTGLGTIVSTQIDSAKPEILLVLTAMAGALVLLIVWALIRRAGGK